MVLSFPSLAITRDYQNLFPPTTDEIHFHVTLLLLAGLKDVRLRMVKGFFATFNIGLSITLNTFGLRFKSPFAFYQNHFVFSYDVREGP